MDNILLELSKKLLIEHISGKSTSYETLHPWRKGWEFALQHSLRVKAYTEQIVAKEKHELSDEDMTLLYTAAILHDVGRMDNCENHASHGAEIARSWFDIHPDFSSRVTDHDKLIYLIKSHSDKNVDDGDLCSNILKDADILDEIGAMSVFMCSNWLNKSSPWFFSHLNERLKRYELKYCDDKLLQLKTQTARSILLEKKAFIEAFIHQLENELQGTLELDYKR